MKTTGLILAAALAGTLAACEICDDAQIIRTDFASEAAHSDAIIACLADRTACIPLCAEVLQVFPGDIRHCEITSIAYHAQVPDARSRLPGITGVTVRTDYISRAMCAIDPGAGFLDPGGVCDSADCGGGINPGGGGVDDGGDGGGGDGGGGEGGLTHAPPGR